MSDTGDQTTDSESARRQLDARVAELERRLRDLENPDTVESRRIVRLETELRVVREAMDDLAAGTLDLHNQMTKVVSSCERVLAGAAAGGAEIMLGGPGVLRRSGSALRRIARAAARRALGAARRMARSPGGKTGAGLELEVRTSAAPVRAAPVLGVVLRVTDDPESFELPVELGAQTDRDLRLAVWNESLGRAVVRRDGEAVTVVDVPSRAALSRTLSAEFIADLRLPLARLRPTIFEICRWTVASEGLPLIVADEGGSSVHRPPWSIVPAESWASPATDGAARGSGVAAKLVGGQGRRPAGFDTMPVIGVGEGCVYVPAPGSAGTLDHEVAPLEGVVSARTSDDERPTVLVTTQLGGAAGDVAAWLVGALGNSYRFIVLVTDTVAGGSGRRRVLADLTPEIYPLAGFLHPTVWPSVAADLVSARRVRTVLRIGRAFDLPDPEESRPLVVDLPLDRNQVASGADLVLAFGDRIADEARGRGLEVEHLVPAPPISGDLPDARRLAAVRSAYGVPEESRLVLAVCDLEPDYRPEDVVAVAHRLRSREDVHFLLVGQGSLAGTVSDIAGYFRLNRFVVSPAGHPLVDLVAAADCVLSTAERDPWPVTVAAALGLARPLVATRVDGVRELVAASGDGRCDLRPPGDVDGLAEGVAAAVDAKPRPRTTRKAWREADARAGRSLGVVRDLLGRGSTDGAAGG